MKTVFFFGNGKADGDASMAEVLGGKGANLAEMTNLGVRVPPGFTISAKLCTKYIESGKIADEVRREVKAAMKKLETAAGRRFGNPADPLLVSVRSGSQASMPGMMDTILDLGLNDSSVLGLAAQSCNDWFAWDSYRRFLQMYAEVVFGIGDSSAGVDPFESALDGLKQERGAESDTDLTAGDLKGLVEEFKGIIERDTGAPFPEDPWQQLWGAIEAVFGSWNTKRAIDYRQLNRIPEDLGTAVSVVSMVYGNMGDDSGTGVVFTRNPSTGENELFGEFLMNAQGEDVVAGIRDPQPIAEMADLLPDTYRELQRTRELLEQHYRDMQDIEFTVERGTLYLLQTRAAKRSAAAAIRVAVEMVETEGLIDRPTALERIAPAQLDQLLHPTIDPTANAVVLTTGLPASPGAAVGQAVFDATLAAEMGNAGENVVLVRRETSPDDFHGMVAAKAILTSRGGMTSHAAVVARGMGKCCVAGARELNVDEQDRCFSVNGTTIREGDWISVDGSTGRVLAGRVPLVQPESSPEFEKLMSWADDTRLLRVRANADTPADAERARSFGAEGIGLCRTEHMFFQDGRISVMREMIVATGLEGRKAALAKLLPMQRQDFVGIFRAMDGLPVTIRLLDPPLHEFLPRETAELKEIAAQLGVPLRTIENRVDVLTETNPMLGHRGCRLGITYPEITEMQSRAIFEAACEASASGVEVHPEVMVPLVAHCEELRLQSELVRKTAEQVFAESDCRVDYLVGTMIELPRAALTADEIAEVSDFFSFGTNDLTQTVFGLSRDDSGQFLSKYLELGILDDDPFQTMDERGVGKLVEIAVELGRGRKPGLKIGICGEHGGDPRSVAFCHQLGLNYVSCSPFRVPIARLAAAQAAQAS